MSNTVQIALKLLKIPEVQELLKIPAVQQLLMAQSSLQSIELVLEEAIQFIDSVINSVVVNNPPPVELLPELIIEGELPIPTVAPTVTQEQYNYILNFAIQIKSRLKVLLDIIKTTATI